MFFVLYFQYKSPNSAYLTLYYKGMYKVQLRLNSNLLLFKWSIADLSVFRIPAESQQKNQLITLLFGFKPKALLYPSFEKQFWYREFWINCLRTFSLC